MLAVEIRNLKKTYPSGVQALKGIDLDIAKGDFFALLGPNGAGKSTTIGVMTSLINKDSGSIKVFGYDQDSQRDWVKANIGLVPQEFNFNVFEKVQQILIKQAGFYGVTKKIAEPRIKTILTALGLWEKRNQRARFLSGGQKRRLLIARALIHQPKLLILDEPTAGVDIELRRLMWDYLQNLNAQGITIILTTHYLEEAESLCKNIAIIDQGQLIEKTSMQSLLNRLHVETFILDLTKPLEQSPQLKEFKCQLKDAVTLQIDIRHEQTINDAFDQLSALGIQVNSLRNKTNRLEETFVAMTSKKGDMAD